jgi:hypothetical protein
VIVAQANHLVRFEYDETDTVLDVADAEVRTEYLTQTGGPDVGLDPIRSLNKWRNTGWIAAGRRHKIKAWASVVAQDQQQTKEATVIGRGLQIGVRLPIRAAHQFDKLQPWDLVAGPDGQAGSWGGHMMYVKGYDAEYAYMWTWKRVQKATWRWLAAYCDFAAVVLDDRNPAPQIDGTVLDSHLAHL